MKEILTTASNQFYRKTQKGDMQHCFELIFVLSEPVFRTDEVGEVIRQRQTETVRMVGSKQTLEAVAGYILEIIEAPDEMQTPPNEQKGG